MWIVMTSAACMPSRCWGTYRRVALVKLNQHYTAHDLRPKMISLRARGVLDMRDLGRHNVGASNRCAYAKALDRANALAFQLNNAEPLAHPELLMGWASA
ncbi:MAG TPA: hypothetical protein VKC66_18410 [Xanthobacteraceae bacterium]|nr:hypothetical protein [Xanthobacteraceae bacterium]